MSASPNLELVRSIYAAWARGDFSSAEWAHPEIEFVRRDGGPTAGSSIGRAGMAEGWREWLSSWANFRVGVEDYRELDSERVLVLNYFSGHGRASGLEVGQMQTQGASLFHVRDGKVMRLVVYGNRALALEDIGLAPEGGAAPPLD